VFLVVNRPVEVEQDCFKRVKIERHATGV
jgi:hypothetical protein